MSPFRSNNDNTISGLRSIQCRSSSIFQYIETLYILRVQSGNSITDTINVIRIIQGLRLYIHRILHNNAVYNPQRFPVTNQSRSTPNTNFRNHPHFPGVSHKNHIRDSPFQHLVNGRDSGNHNIPNLHGRYRTGIFPPIHNLITRDHNLFHLAHLFFHHHAQRLLPLWAEVLPRISQ